MPMKEWIERYLHALQSSLRGLPVDEIARAVELMRFAGREGRQVFAFGNGGSASTCSHFVTDLGKGASDATGRRFRFQSLNDDVGWMTAIANDYDYADVFVRQLENFAEPGDVVLCLSVSGTSPNVVRAARWAHEHDLRVVALLGNGQCNLPRIADVCIRVDSGHCGIVEDGHLVICHILCYAFMDNPELLEN